MGTKFAKCINKQRNLRFAFCYLSTLSCVSLGVRLLVAGSILSQWREYGEMYRDGAIGSQRNALDFSSLAKVCILLLCHQSHGLS